MFRGMAHKAAIGCVMPSVLQRDESKLDDTCNRGASKLALHPGTKTRWTSIHTRLLVATAYAGRDN
ncbi:MAG: hypothetical protein RL701_4185, partial [Pseudomonadota bacterium]